VQTGGVVALLPFPYLPDIKKEEGSLYSDTLPVPQVTRYEGLMQPSIPLPGPSSQGKKGYKDGLRF
jgi:hypothetical protein